MSLNGMSFNWRRQACWMMAFWLFSACSNGPVKKEAYDTPTSGAIHISVDESFKPVIDEQIKVFESSYPDAKIIAHYKAEADCLKDLISDSTRMVIITRALTWEEERFLKDTLTYSPSQEKLAYDAITLIVNNNSKDTIFDLADIRSLLKGTSGYKYKVVMDGLTATSTVRYALDSLLKGQAFGQNVTAAKNSQAVIDYVAANEDAIGFVGVSWIGDQTDTNMLSFTGKVKIASVECVNCDPVAYVKPYQANIGLKRYPMVRALQAVVKENFQGLGSGFTNFLIYERGQLIFRKAYLWPVRMALGVRKTNI
ncbi:MAG: substrate-binding domain-containing protein [Chitinophagaceae bacterium]|nr:substrate-binding domain-containing protein [Chitinophagaceae bacterium]